MMGPPQRLKRRITIAKRSFKRRFLRRRSSAPNLNVKTSEEDEDIVVSHSELPCSSSACPLSALHNVDIDRDDMENQAEVGHTCRGAINLQGAYIHKEDSSNIVVSGRTQTFHLKASNEVERQRWLTALELARVRAIRAAESDEDEELKYEQEEADSDSKSDIQTTLRALQTKINDLSTCQDLIVKHGSSLQKTLAELEHVTGSDKSVKAKTVSERATLFRITTNAMINACTEFVSLAETHGKKWQRLLQHEHQQRLQLQEQLIQLARQHSVLERACDRAKDHDHQQQPMTVYSESEDEADFHDAEEEIGEFGSQKSETKRGLRRSDSTVSGNQEEEKDEERQRSLSYFSAQIVTKKDSPGQEGKGWEAPEETVQESPQSGGGGGVMERERRKRIPSKPNASMSLWSIMKNCIGKELSKIPMPVNFNEPLSMLQRLTEDLEYSSILDKAAVMGDSCEEMAYVAAFTVSSYSTTTLRTGKPFNPLLGETFEADRRPDLGWRSFCEQVSHHPPAAAQYAEGNAGWRLWQEFTMSSKFRGKYMSVIPLGIAHLEFHKSGNHYTWRKVTTTVHNIIVGRLWIDNHGEMTIENHKTGDRCHLKYVPYSYFSRDTPRKVTGVVTDSGGTVKWVVQGTWDDYIEIAKVLSSSAQKSEGKPVFETLAPKLVWKKHPPLPRSEEIYHFTRLAVELNEEEEGVAPSDSRLRPDQRLMENGVYDRANEEKLRLEEKQRTVRRRRETDAERAVIQGRSFKDYEPVWFVKQKDPQTGSLIHMYTGQYWKAKEKKDWSKCPDIY